MSAVEDQWRIGPTLLEVAGRYRYSVVAAAVIAGLLGYFGSAELPPRYEAVARLYLDSPQESQPLTEDNFFAGEPERYVPQQADRLTSRPVLARISELLGGEVTVGALEDQIEVEGDAELNTVEIVASAETGEQAAAIANAAAEAYEASVRDRVNRDAQVALEQLGSARQGLEEQLAAVRAEIAEQPPEAEPATDPVLASRLQTFSEQLLQLELRAQQIAVDAASFGSGVEFVETAEVPEEPVSPDLMRNTAVAAVLGMVLALAFAYHRASRDLRAEAYSDPAAVLDAPFLGKVPAYRPPKQGGVAPRLGLGLGVEQAYEFLLTSIEYALADIGGRSVLITSAGPGDGKTETSLQVGMAAVRDGRQAILIDADIRAEGLTRLVGLEGQPGIADVSAADASLQQALSWHPVRSGARLPILPTGSQVEDPTGYLRSTGFRRLMQHLHDEFELVILDSSPVLAVADVSIVAGSVDGIVLVVNRGTPLRDLQQVKERLAFVSTPLLGYVFNRTGDSSSAYGYGARYDRGQRGRRGSAQWRDEGPHAAPTRLPAPEARRSEQETAS